MPRFGPPFGGRPSARLDGLPEIDREEDPPEGDIPPEA